MAAEHPCAGLSARATEVFEQIAVNEDTGHHPRILKQLVERGLIEPREETVAGPFRGTTIAVTRYSVPMPVHMAWCAWCAENVTDEDIQALVEGRN